MANSFKILYRNLLSSFFHMQIEINEKKNIRFITSHQQKRAFDDGSHFFFTFQLGANVENPTIKISTHPYVLQ